MSTIALGGWTLATSAVQIPIGATSLRWTVAPNLDVSTGAPVVGPNGQIAYLTIGYHASGVYTVAINGGSDVVADATADGLATADAVLDFLAAGLLSTYPSQTYARITRDGDDTLVIASPLSHPSFEVDCTGGSATLDIEASALEVTTVTCAALTSIGGQSAAIALDASQAGQLVGGHVPLPPGLTAILVNAQPDNSSPPDTDAGAANASRFSASWVQFYRDVP